MNIGKLFKNIPLEFKNHKVSSLSFNSKICKNGDIFFSIKGNNKNGNQFIAEAIKKGARTIVSDLKLQGIKDDILYIKTKNSRKLLSEVSSKFYEKKPENLIAVTGTNGKSSIVNFYFQILNINKVKAASIGTLGINYPYGNKKIINTTLDPINLNKTLEELKKKNINNVILEASSHGLKQNRLDGLKFDTAIFTNLSRDHLDYHRTYKDYLNSKLILFNKLLKKNSTIIFDNDTPQSNIFKKISTNKKLKSYRIGKKNSDIVVKKHLFLGDSQKVEFIFKKKLYSFSTNLIGKIQIKNIFMAILAAKNSKIKFSKIVESVNKIKPVNGRLEKIGNIKNNSKVILDYAHTPEALKTSLKNIKEQFKFSDISIVFGCGGERDKLKRSIMGKIANTYCRKIYLTDDNPRNENPQKIRNQIKVYIKKSKLREIQSRERAIGQAIQELKSGSILLVSGKGHEIYQEYSTIKKNLSDRKCIIHQIKIKNKILFNDLKLNILNEKINLNFLRKNTKINEASINSKEIKKNDIFFAIKGKKKDGNYYSDEAIQKGASLVIVNKKNKKNIAKEIKVKNTLKFLTENSYNIRKTSNAKIISITGSAGKTSLKELLSYSLKKLSSITYSKKSFNNKFGVPISLFNLKKKDKFGIFEVGMDKKGEINYLTKNIIPDLGIITNISYAHIKNFKNLKEIAAAKSEMMNNIIQNGTIVLNKDDSYFNFLKNIALNKKLKVISFSKNKSSADIFLKKIIKYKSNFKAIFKINNYYRSFVIKNSLKPYVENLLASVSVISEFFNLKTINEKLFFDFSLPNSRGDFSKIKISNKKLFLIDESYNSNPLSLEFAVRNFDSLKFNNQRKYLFLSDMLEMGKFSKTLHRNIAKIINKTSIDKVYVYGKDIKETYYAISPDKRGKILNNINEIYNLIKNDLNNNDYLMIKGSNSTGLNKFVTKIKKARINAS
jgi:murE/murF fusion protein